jgi:predicted methyltransferase
MHFAMQHKYAILFAVVGAAACSHNTAPKSGDADTSVNYTEIVSEPDRTQEDQALDAGRHPADVLKFCKARPGMHAEELAAGRGYLTELLARTAAPTGVVYAENPDPFLKYVGEEWTARLARSQMGNVVRVDRPLEAPFPPEAKDLDLVVASLVYHDLVWLDVDRAAMNKAVFDALKPGGYYVVIDHSAAQGRGTTDVKTLHRIDEATVLSEIQAAGFKLDDQGHFLRNAEDTRDWDPSPRAAGEKRGTSDRFALRFVKP